MLPITCDTVHQQVLCVCRDGLDGAVDSAAMCNTAVLGELRPWTWCAIGSQYVSSATLGATPIVDRWSKSPQHISTMMSEMGTHVGLGYHVCGNGRTYWGQIMIRKPIAADAPLVSAVAATVPEGAHWKSDGLLYAADL